MNPDDRKHWFGLSYAQRSRWFMYQWTPQRQGQHNNVFVVRLRGALDEAALSDALLGLSKRHPMLRARFVDDAGEPRQSVDFAPEVPLIHADASGWSQADLYARVHADALRPFDLRHGPAIRAHLYRCGADEAVFCLSIDHLVSDGWSYWRLLAELGARLSGEPVGPGVPVRYEDYVAWQRDWIDGADARRQLDHWRQALSGDLPVLRLSFAERSSAAAPTCEGRRAFIRLDLSAERMRGLHALVARHSGTLFTCLLAAYQIALHCYTGQDDVIVGCPMPARGQGEWDELTGDFVNIIALRTRLDDDCELQEALRRVRAAAFQGMAHQDYPFAALLEQLRIPRTDMHPVFQASFTWQKARSDAGLHRLWAEDGGAGQALRWGGATLSAFPTHQHIGMDGIALSLQAIQLGDAVRCDFGFDAGQLDQAAMERFVAGFEVLLDSMATAAPTTRIGELPILPPGQREQVTAGFNDTLAQYRSASSVHGLFEEQVRRDGAAIALQSGAQTLSYAELNRRANRLAHRLIGLGVGPDRRVAICMHRSADMVVGLLGILKAGGAYVPVDPDYPQERQAYMLENSAPMALLTQAALAQRLPACAAPVLIVDTDETAQQLAAQPDHDPDPVALGLGPQHLAYVIYTSGSTGRPKGAMNQHDGVVNRLLWAQEQFGLGLHDRVLQKTPFGFDVSVWEFFLPLLAGARLVLARPGGHQDPQYLAETIETDAITVAHFVPSMLQVFLDQADLSRCASLRQVLCSGEALPAALQDRLLQALPQVALYNLYGPTEAAVDVTCWRCERGMAVVPIGYPIANTQLYIVDRHLRPVPIGVAGELLIGGVQVARGYLDQPQLSAERFIDHPFDPSGGKVYRTGDLGRWRADGSIEYLGRNDFQVKLRGFRIELGEIEAQLQRCAGVREAVVLAREDRPGDKRLVAYVVAQEGAQLSVPALREALARTLAEYMVPGAFVLLEALPLTANGKLDRKALPAPGADAVAARAYEAPQGEVEQALARIWTELLGVETVGRHDHFFELGGHSLLALQVAARLRAWRGVDLELQELFAHPVLADLAASLDGRDGAHDPIVPVPRDGALALSPAQQRLWFLDQLDPASSVAYHMPAALKLDGRLDRQALRHALDALVARHEALRTRFETVDEVPRQAIAPASAGFALVEHDVRGDDAAARQAKVDRWSAHEATAVFDLSAGPLIRGRLLRLGEEEHLLLVTQHHIVSDGWSIGVLVRELMELYAAARQGRPDPLPALPLQYADYAAWQHGQLQGARLQAQQDYWRRQLAGAPALLELPTDRPRPAVQSHAGAGMAVRIPAELTQRLRALSQRRGTTLFMTLLAAWAALLSRLSGQDDVVVGTPVANRPRRELESVVGFFVNTLALRVRTDADLDVAGLLAQVKATVLDAFAHQALPFDQVVEATRPVRSLGHNAVFQTLFALDNTPAVDFALAGLAVEALEPAHSSTQFDLSLALSERDGALAGRIEYASDLFDPATIERWRGHFETLLAAMASDDEAIVAQLPLQPPHERQAMLAAFNATAMPLASARALHVWFEQQARRNGAAIALESAAGALSYAELNRRANRLAHHLIGLGVGPDQRVAICLRRGPDLVVALLAVLKAGGAYVPLDPGYPRERLGYMLADSAPRCVLSQTALREALPACEAKVVWLDEAAQLAAQPEHDPDPAALGLEPQHLAYVIYTSGSTGQPKGVMIRHANADNFVAWSLRSFPPEVLARTVFSTSINFDLAVFELFVPLAAGATVVLVENLLVADASLLERATLLNTVPSAIEALLDRAVALTAAKQINLAGEPLRRSLVERLFAQTPVETVANLYGPSETTTYSTWVPMRRAQGFLAHIGRPVGNTQVYILDARMQPVPVGVSGEIMIGGAGVARGYLNQPRLSAERFVEHPFDPAGGKVYRTGDLGRWRPDGNIEYLGRNDFQVKLRGFRIELGEIEARLRQCAGVREAVVLAREDRPGDKRLVAYVVAGEGVQLSLPALREALARTLAEYMLPGAFVLLDALPLTPNGKLDRQALPAPEPDASAARGYEAPQGEVELALARIWAELLGLERVGRHDHFFEMGGHSLGVARMIARLREVLRLQLPVKTVFQQPTIAQLAVWLQSQQGADAIPALPPVRRAPRDQDLPLSFAQQRLWFDDRFTPASAAYNMPAAMHIQGPLDVPAFTRTIGTLFERHEALRTVFAVKNDVPVQLVAGVPDVPVLIEDLSGLPMPEQVRLAEALAAQEAAAPFDLSAGPLFRVKLLRLGENRHLLLMTAHHIVCDGWSIELMKQEIGQIYQAYASGESPRLPELPVQYPDYARWQREQMRGDYARTHLDYWRRTLGGAFTPRDLPTDRPRTTTSLTRGEYRHFALPDDLVSGLRQLSQQEGTTLFMTLLAAFDVLLAHHTGGDDIVVGTAVAGRGPIEVERLIGCFVNMLVLRTDLSGDPRFRELLARVKDTSMGAYAHQDLPFDLLVDELKPERRPGRSPFFQVAFGLQNQHKLSIDAAGLTLSPYPVKNEAIRYDLTVWVYEDADALEIKWSFRSDLFDAQSIERLHRHYLSLLRNAVADPDVRISRLQMHAGDAHERGGTAAQPPPGADPAPFSKGRRKAIPVPAKEQETSIMSEPHHPPSAGESPFKRRKSIRISKEALIKTGFLDDRGPCPLVVQPLVEGLNLAGWAEANVDFIDEQLNTHGALLFRGFRLPEVSQFEQFVKGTSGDPLTYNERSSPRSQVRGAIYTSTDHPPEYSIFLHNEQSYNITFPARIFFHCLVASDTGGQTPIADTRGVLRRISAQTRERFERDGYMYVRNFGDGLGLSWQTAFQTDDPAAVEAYCRNNRIEYEWKGEGRLKTWQVRRVTARHAPTGETVWFNHATFFNVSTLDGQIQQQLLAQFGEDALPNHTCYGDGTPIPAEVMKELREAYLAEKIVFPWQHGDVLMLDNMLCAHGREPYAGARKIVVGMARPCDWSDV